MRSIYEVKAQKELEKEGYKVDWKMRPNRMMRMGTYSPDYFGLFDLLAYKKKESLRWISIKGKAGIPGEHLKEIKAFILPPNNIKEIWGKSTGKDKTKYWHKIII